MKSVLLLVTLCLFLSVSGQKNAMLIYDLKCENLHDPLGIDKTAPRLSWKIKSSENGTAQKAYQILVSSVPSKLQEGKADLWDSGKTASSSSIWISYQGKPLGSGLPAFWKVRVWDESGNVSEWSPTASFSIGLLEKKDWKAAYIGFPTDSGYRECPQLMKTFQVKNTSGKLFLHVNSLGYHEVFLNGQKVSNGVLAPAVSQFDKRSWVLTYDVSSLLKKGQNELVLWLGSGWYTEGLPGVANNGPLVKAQLEQVIDHKREILLATDASWVGRSSSYYRHGDWRPHRFGGEIVDGSLANTDLDIKAVGREWNPVKVAVVPDAEVRPQMVEQNKITETIKAISVTPAGDGSFLVDMGKSVVGWTEIKFLKLQKAQKIVIEYSDHLDKNERFANQRQTDYYIASGEGNEVFKNKFNYHGYRYIRISKLQEAPSVDAVKGYLIHTGYELASGFECSDQELNRIHDMIFYTLRCLSIGGDLVDCPTIERLGYGGDGNASTQTAQMMFDLNPMYLNWLQAWADCVREDGGMPHTAPNPYKAGGGPYWCGFIITAAWRTYQNYGDLAILEKYYPVMQKWLGYVDAHSTNGLLTGWPDTDYRNWYLGDWATPTGIDQKAPASIGLVNNCFVAVCLDNMLQIAQVLGKTNDAAIYAQKKADVQQKVHQQYFDPAKKTYATGTQIDLAYPMLSGVVPENLISAVTQSLEKETENRAGHFATGLVGIPVLTEWAVKNKTTDLFYSMLKKKDYPGYLYMIENGATTTWEHWNGDRSRIHNCYNGIGSWFYQAVGGIGSVGDVPAYRKVLISPQIPKGVNWAKTFKETPYGKLTVDWELKEKKMELIVEIPVGIDAEVAIPSGVKKYNLNGEEYELTGNNRSLVAIKSGKYKINYTL